MATETSNWIPVSDGEQTTATVPSDAPVIATEVRWRGDADTRTVQQSSSNYSSTPFHEYTTIQATFPDPPSPSVVRGVATIQLRADAQNDFEATFLIKLPGRNISKSFVPGRFAEFEYTINNPVGKTIEVVGDVAIGNSGAGGYMGIKAETVYEETIYSATYNPTTTLNNGDSASASGRFTGGEVTDWQSISGLSSGSNTFSHSIGSIGTAEFQYRYDYQSAVAGSAFPTSGCGAPTASDLTALSATAQPTAGQGAPSAPALAGIDSTQRWVATLEATNGDTIELDSEQLVSVQIDGEHTAAWGGTVELPPIIDPQKYRDGTMMLSYDGALQLDCADITERSIGNDGTITIGGLGPSAQLKTFPVDRSFNDVFVHDAIFELLMQDTPLPASRLTVHEPPENKVINEVVREASTQTEFEEALLSRNRGSDGQFQTGPVAGESPEWLATDPFAFTSGGGARTRQSCIVREAEAFDSATGTVAPMSAAGASGNQGITLAESADGCTFGYDFGYDIPEAEFAIAVRGRAPGGTGTTTIRVSSDDRELFSFDADSHDSTWSWTHHATGYQPGTDSHTLSFDVSSAGGAPLDIDCIAIYDSRYKYMFDNQTDSNDALAGPQLYPDSAPLRFQPVPAGIGLDSATVTVTVDDVGAGGSVGVVYTSTGGESSESIDNLTDSHTAEFTGGGATARVRPTVALSRTTQATADTPTTGNRPQTLKSIETSVSGNAIPVIDSREFEATTAFDALQSLCSDYDFNWAIDPHRSAERLALEIFQRGDPAVQRELPPAARILDSSQDAEAQGYKNVVTVVGAEIPDSPNERYSWTEEAPDEIDTFGREPLRIENDELQSENDCRSVARSELRKRLDEDEHGGSLATTPEIVVPGYPYHVPEWEEHTDYQPPGWGNFAWGQAPWGGYPGVYATLETSSLSAARDGGDTSLDFSVQSSALAALAGEI